MLAAVSQKLCRAIQSYVQDRTEQKKKLILFPLSEEDSSCLLLASSLHVPLLLLVFVQGTETSKW